MNKSLALKMFGVLSSQPPIEIWHLYLSCVMNMIHLKSTNQLSIFKEKKISELCALPIVGYVLSFY